MSTISPQSQITTAFSCYVLFFLPLWVVLPAMNEYIIARRCLALHGVFATTGTICGSNDVSASAQNWSTWTMLACNLPSLLVVLPLGHQADRWGRRTILLWCLGTQVFGSAGMLLVCLFRLDLIWLVPTYVVNGFGGGSYTLQTILLSTLVDCSNTRSHRARLLATMTAMYYFCGCVGPLVGGYLSKANLIIFPSLHGSQYQLAYVIFFVSNALVLLLAVVSFEETLPPPPPPSKDSDSDGGSGDLRLETTETICSVFRSALAPLRSRQVRVLSVVFCLMYATVNVGVSGLIVAYAKLKMFDMSDETIGIFLALPWFLRAVSAAIIFPLLLNYFVVRRESSSEVSNENRMSSLLLLEEVFSSEDDAELERAAESAQRAGNAAIQSSSIYIVRLGATLSMLVFASFGLATTTPLLFFFCGVEGFAAVWDSACSILFSSLSEVEDGGNVEMAAATSNQGSMLGLRALLQTSMACVGPFVFNGVYVATLDWIRPFAFYVLSACCALALAFSFMWRH